MTSNNSHVNNKLNRGKKLNELNIPTRPRARSEYPSVPRPSETFIPSGENTHSTTLNRKDIDASVQPIIVQPPSTSSPAPSVSSVPSRPGYNDGQNNTIKALPNSGPGLGPGPGPGPVFKQQTQPRWPTLPVDQQAARPDITATTSDRSQPRFPPVAKVENPPKNTGQNGTSSTPTSSHATPSKPPQSEIPEINTSRPQQHQDPKPADRHPQSFSGGDPMDVDIILNQKPHERTTTLQPAAQPNDIHPVDAIPSTNASIQTITNPAVSSAPINTSPGREGVAFAGSAEANAVGMKNNLGLLEQNSQNLRPSGPVVAGMSQSKLEQAKVQTAVPDSNNATMKAKNDIREAGAIINSVEPPKTPSSSVCAPIPEEPKAIAVDQGTNDIHTSTNSFRPPEPLQPPQSLHSLPSLPLPLPSSNPSPQPPSDAFRSLPTANMRGDLHQTPSKPTNPVVFNNNDSADGNGYKVEATREESSAIVSESIKVEPQSHGQETQNSPTPIIPIQAPPPERKRTSSPSGVARQKPVAEILGEPLKPSRDPEASSMTDQKPSMESNHTPRGLLQKANSKKKQRSTTVVFGNQAKHAMNSDNSLTQNRPQAQNGSMASDDYFTPLFVQAFATNSKWMKPLDQILHQAHKTLSTPDSYTQIFENQACKVLKRVYQLQHHNKWSLRQPKRCPEPTRQPCHWDVLLQEMKWMRTDFREERKWKMAAARNLAYACAEWVSASPEIRKAMQVNAVSPSDDRQVSMDDAPQNLDNQPTPDLIQCADFDSPLEPDDELQDSLPDTIAPSAIFALESDDVIFALHQSATADRLLDELPMYGSPLEVPKSDLTAPEYDPDATWRRPALPVSKYVEGRMELAPMEPPRKRSRYRYIQEDDEDEEVIFENYSGSQPRLEPQNPEVALFRPENKSIRDRLHAGHQFRPPNEHTMPFQSFYESRSPSQWIQSEDDELKSLVREYSYNWSLICSILSSKSMFSSGAERRTPWECFERWVMLEGLPHDMQKTQYFKLWQGRIEASQQVIRQHQNAIQQQQAAQQQQAGNNTPVAPIPKRRYNVPLKVERRRNQKHLTMIDAMRKLAKKRETAIQKQQHAASLAAMRKTNEAPQPRAPTKTPREYSIMRFERDQAMAERLAERMAQQQRHEAQRRVGIPLF